VGTGLGHDAGGTQRQLLLPGVTMAGNCGQLAGGTCGGTSVPTIS